MGNGYRETGLNRAAYVLKARRFYLQKIGTCPKGKAKLAVCTYALQKFGNTTQLLRHFSLLLFNTIL